MTFKNECRIYANPKYFPTFWDSQVHYCQIWLSPFVFRYHNVWLLPLFTYTDLQSQFRTSFYQFLAAVQKTEKLRVNICFETSMLCYRRQQVTIVKLLHKHFLALYILIFVLYFDSNVISNQMKYYLTKRIFCICTMTFTGMFCRLTAWITTTQTKNNNLDHIIDPTFMSSNRLLVLSFKNVDDDPTRSFFEIVKINSAP